MLHVVCVATLNESHLQKLIDSCKTCKDFDLYAKFYCIGQGEKWNGFGTKLKIFKQFLLNQTKDDDIIALVDAYDVLFVNDSVLEFIEKFSSLNVDFVFSRDCFNLSFIKTYFLDKVFTHLRNYPDIKTNVNAGLMMGYVRAYRYLFEHVFDKYIKENHLDYESADDQRILNICLNDTQMFTFKSPHTYIAQNNMSFYFDFDSCLLLTTDLDSFMKVYKKKEIFFVHFPGNVQLTDVYKIYSNRLPSFNISTIEKRNKSYNSVGHFIRTYMKYFYFDIVCGVMFVSIFLVVYLRCWQ